MKVIKITKLQGGGFTVEVVVKGQTIRTFECATLEETKAVEYRLTIILNYCRIKEMKGKQNEVQRTQQHNQLCSTQEDYNERTS